MNYRLTWLLRRAPGGYRTLGDLAAEVGLPAETVGAEIDRMQEEGFCVEQHPLLGVRLTRVPEGKHELELIEKPVRLAA